MDRAVFDEALRRRLGPDRVLGRCRAPGRVNLIGEHLDYNGLSVLPMTLDRELRMGWRARSDHSVVTVSADAGFREGRFENRGQIPLSTAGSWENYVKAAVQALNSYFGIEEGPGFEVFVCSEIPPASGLSSSAALVVATGLAYLDLLGRPLEESFTRPELAEFLAGAERLSGTAGGAMDHAICLLGDADHALKIDFDPIRTEPLPLLPGHTFVVCHCGVDAAKSGAANAGYNLGPAACELIRTLVERHLQESWDDSIEIANLGELWTGPLCLTHEEAGEVIEAAVPKLPLRIEDVAKRAGENAASIAARLPRGVNLNSTALDLAGKARHVRTEFHRVEAMRDALHAGDAHYVGALMSESHESCARDYGVSCDALDRLVAASLEAGALGARMTGAGFGGCTVSLVETERLKGFIDALRGSFYGGDDGGRILVAKAAAAAGYIDA